MPRTNAPGSLVILQLALGVFFIITGLEILINYNSTMGQIVNGLSKIFGGSKPVLEMVIAIIEIVCGAILILTLLLPMGSGGFNFIILLISLLWVARIVYFDFLNRELFVANWNWLAWLRDLALDVIVLIGIWVTRSKHTSN